MTKEEIKNLRELIDLMLDKCILADSRTKVFKRLEEVCDLAIRALEQDYCCDAISREEAIKKFTYNYKGERIPDYDCDNFPVQIDIKTVKETLRDLPPVNPQQKIGHWIKIPLIEAGQTYSHECSLCGRRILVTEVGLSEFPYCHCGARMRESEE